MRVLICQQYPTEGGIQLAADVYLPDGGGSFPVVICRTPYDRVGHLQQWGHRFVQRGYAFVATDCRGRFESDGAYTKPFEEIMDGEATLDWVANQPWCNGAMGLWGRSYGGVFQVPAAISQHPALKCICPSIICSNMFVNWCRYDGCFALRNPLWWSVSNASNRTQPPMDHVDWDALHAMPDLDAVEDALGFAVPMLRNWAEHDTQDAYWDRLDQRLLYPKVGVPGLHGGGWFDHVSSGAYEGYQGIRDHGATEAARAGQRLLIGPWGHISFIQEGDEHRRYGAWDFGQSADYCVFEHDCRFFDLHLRGVEDGMAGEKPVRVFLMGENRWIDADDWPLPGARTEHWHLGSDGDAHGTRGGGSLKLDSATVTGENELVYDPADPVPTCGGNIFWNMEPRGPMDQRHLLERDDVLFYQGEPLAAPLQVVGPVELDLTISTDVDDTDIIAKLCVVQPDRAVMCLVIGSFRCRYHQGWDKSVPLEHNTPTALTLRMSELGYTFPEGSRIALMITSSDYPRIQPNSNTMARPWQPAKPVIAHTRVLHGPGIDSALKLPVVSV